MPFFSILSFYPPCRLPQCTVGADILLDCTRTAHGVRSCSITPHTPHPWRDGPRPTLTPAPAPEQVWHNWQERRCSTLTLSTHPLSALDRSVMMQSGPEHVNVLYTEPDLALCVTAEVCAWSGLRATFFDGHRILTLREGTQK